jgi:hypothetical protein
MAEQPQPDTKADSKLTDTTSSTSTERTGNTSIMNTTSSITG